jgi:hypothetical protein
LHALRNPLGVLPDRIADSSSRNAVNFSSARTTKRFRHVHARVEFLWILMLDHSLALRLKNQTVGYLE